METINYLSIIIEAAVAVLGVMIAVGKKRLYGWGLALTFLIYVFYDLARTQNWQIPTMVMTISFLVATVSALLAAYSIYKKQ